MLDDRDIAVLTRLAEAIEALKPLLETVAQSSLAVAEVQQKIATPLVTLPAQPANV